MKKLLIFLPIVAGLISAAQTPTVVTRSSPSVIAVDAHLWVKSLKIPVYADTPHALATAGIDSIGLIFKELNTSKVWVRDSNLVAGGHIWTQIGTGSGGGVTTASGDASGTASGSNLPLTLATVNSNTGAWGDATHVGQITVNAKGLTTAAANVLIQIAESQVTNLTTDLAGKQATGNYITGLTGDVTAAGPGSVPATLANTTVTPGSYTNLNATIDSKGRITAASNGSGSSGGSGTVNSGTANQLAYYAGTGTAVSGLTNTMNQYSRLMTDVNGLPVSQAEILHQQVQYATVGALPANTYSNGSSGIGATLTATANGALSMDGSAVVVNDRVLVKDEVSQANNGIYVVTQAGDGSHPYILTRGNYSAIPANLAAMMQVAVQKGVQNVGQIFSQTTAGGVTVGTTLLNFLNIGGTSFTNTHNASFASNGIPTPGKWQLDCEYYVYWGQSNAGGGAEDGATADTASDPRVFVWDYNAVVPHWVIAHIGSSPFNTTSPVQLSPTWWFYFARERARRTGHKIYLVGMFSNATALSGWFTTTRQSLTDTLINRMRASAIPYVDAVLGDQGESDAGTAFATYQQELDSLISTIRRESIVPRYCKFVMVGMPDTLSGAPTGYQGVEPQIRANQYGGDPYRGFAYTDSVQVNTGIGNHVHFSSWGLYKIGTERIPAALGAIPFRDWERNNPGGVAVGSTINPGWIKVNFNVAATTGAEEDGVQITNHNAAGYGGISIFNDNGSGELDVRLTGSTANFFGTNTAAIMTPTNTDFKLGRNSVPFLLMTAPGAINTLTIPVKGIYTAPQQFDFNNASNSASGAGFTETMDGSIFYSNQLAGSTNATLPGTLKEYLTNGYVTIKGTTGTEFLNSSSITHAAYSTLEDNGSISQRIDSGLVNNNTLNSNNNIVLKATGTASDTFYLPPASSAINRIYTIKKTDTGTTGTVVIIPNGTNTVDRQRVNITLTGANPLVIIQSDGIANWYTLSNPASSGSGVTTVGSFSGSSQTNGASISGSTITFGPADATNPGMISTGAQTIAGAKTFNAAVGIGGGSYGPSLYINSNPSSSTAAGSNGFWLDIPGGKTNTDGAGGTVGVGAVAYFGVQTLAATPTTTYGDAATLWVNGAPSAGSNVMITNPWAFYVNAGKSRLNGDVFFNAHRIGPTSGPSIAAGAGAGTGPTVTISGNDHDGLITVTTGTVPSGTGSAISTITYATTFPNNSFVTLTPGDANTALLSGATMVFVSSSTSNFVIDSGTTGLTAATTYHWYYHVGGN